MKIIPILFILLFSFFATDFSAQEKIWFDANWNVTTKDKATYYRFASENKTEKQQVIDYYISGKKAKEVYYVSGKPDGKSSEYYVSGELKTTGKFKDGLKDGMWKTYYKNGKIKEKGRYNKGEKVGVWKIYYKNN